MFGISGTTLIRPLDVSAARAEEPTEEPCLARRPLPETTPILETEQM